MYAVLEICLKLSLPFLCGRGPRGEGRGEGEVASCFSVGFLSLTTIASLRSGTAILSAYPSSIFSSQSVYTIARGNVSSCVNFNTSYSAGAARLNQVCLNPPTVTDMCNFTSCDQLSRIFFHFGDRVLIQIFSNPPATAPAPLSLQLVERGSGPVLVAPYNWILEKTFMLQGSLLKV